MFRSSNQQMILPMPGDRWGTREAKPVQRRRSWGGDGNQTVGDVYLKKLTIKPREHWPQWVITRIAPNDDGIMHATLSLLGDEATTRRMSLSVLDDREDWELMHKASEQPVPVEQ
jgi:hypothetical protein